MGAGLEWCVGERCMGHGVSCAGCALRAKLEGYGGLWCVLVEAWVRGVCVGRGVCVCVGCALGA